MQKLPQASLMKSLPAAKPFRRTLGHDYAFSDVYGAFILAARYCGKVPFYPPPGIWQHGCFGPWDQVEAGTILYHSPAKKKFKVFVARNDECRFLEAQGITNCSAIGLPFVYAPSKKVSRRKGSLLVVPVHTLPGRSHFGGADELAQYAQQIGKIRKYFSDVVLCVHRGDVVNNHWIPEFAQLGISYVIGGDSSDLNSLARVKQLFHSFDYVTTNGWGSHVAYALSCGAKCSIWGVQPTVNEEMLSRDLGRGNETEMRLRFSDSVRKAREEFLKGLYVVPTEGVADEDLGAFLIGRCHKRTPRELYEEFEWDKVRFSEKWRLGASFGNRYLRSKSRQFIHAAIPGPVRGAIKQLAGL